MAPDNRGSDLKPPFHRNGDGKIREIRWPLSNFLRAARDRRSRCGVLTGAIRITIKFNRPSCKRALRISNITASFARSFHLFDVTSASNNRGSAGIVEDTNRGLVDDKTMFLPDDILAINRRSFSLPRVHSARICIVGECKLRRFFFLRSFGAI